PCQDSRQHSSQEGISDTSGFRAPDQASDKRADGGEDDTQDNRQHKHPPERCYHRTFARLSHVYSLWSMSLLARLHFAARWLGGECDDSLEIVHEGQGPIIGASDVQCKYRYFSVPMVAYH